MPQVEQNQWVLAPEGTQNDRIGVSLNHFSNREDAMTAAATTMEPIYLPGVENNP